MNINLYSICYKFDHFGNVPKIMIPFDNLENKNSHLCEFPVFIRGYNQATNDNADLWGFLSPKFERKIDLPASTVYDWISKNPNRANAFIINPVPINEALSQSTITQGEMYHPGIMSLMNKIITKMGIQVDLQHVWMDSHSFTLCNYFVADKIFWDRYLDFGNIFLSFIEEDECDRKLMFETSAGYGPNTSLPYYTFVMERLLSLFIMLNSDLKVEFYEYSRDQLINKNKQSDQVIDSLRSLSMMKKAAISGKQSYLIEAYIFHRNELLSKYPYLFNLE